MTGRGREFQQQADRSTCPVACIFDFEEDRLVCEKVYFDFATMLRQLGALPEPATT